MTDRDTFAAAALTGVIANEGEGASLSATCAYSYRIADAMLAERAKQNTFPHGSGSGLINRNAESQSPASECGGSAPLDDTRRDTNREATGGRGHFVFSEGDEDALEYVVHEGRVAGPWDRGVLTSLLERLRRFNKASSDRPEPIGGDGSDRSKPIAAWQLVHENERLRDEVARLRNERVVRLPFEFGGSQYFTAVSEAMQRAGVRLEVEACTS